ncbi:MAG TPA: FixH family protein [Kofleriaceae bacterium]
MRAVSLIAVSLLAAACTNTDSTGDDDDTVDCSTVTGADTFTVGLDKPGAAGLADFKLMSIDPAPAIRGDNTWIVQVSSMESGVVGTPMDGAELSASPYMPAHMHGSPKIPVVTATGNPGEYSIAPINLWMPGVWQTTIAVTTGPNSDRATFAFCIN